jgi:hypothetical protein
MALRARRAGVDARSQHMKPSLTVLAAIAFLCFPYCPWGITVISNYFAVKPGSSLETRVATTCTCISAFILAPQKIVVIANLTRVPREIDVEQREFGVDTKAVLTVGTTVT